MSIKCNAEETRSHFGECDPVCDKLFDSINDHIEEMRTKGHKTKYRFPDIRSDTSYLDCLPVIKYKLRNMGYTVAEGGNYAPSYMGFCGNHDWLEISWNPSIWDYINNFCDKFGRKIYD